MSDLYNEGQVLRDMENEQWGYDCESAVWDLKNEGRYVWDSRQHVYRDLWAEEEAERNSVLDE